MMAKVVTGAMFALQQYTPFFEQSIPVRNRLSYPTYVGIQDWQK
jgi:hypothetical protein